MNSVGGHDDITHLDVNVKTTLLSILKRVSDPQKLSLVVTSGLAHEEACICRHPFSSPAEADSERDGRSDSKFKIAPARACN